MANTYDIIHGWYENGYEGLPEITDEDEGKILTVNDGEAIWGDNIIGIYNTIITTDEDNENGLIFENTWNNINNAYIAGKLIPVYYSDPHELTGFIASVWTVDDESDTPDGYYLGVIHFGSDELIEFYCENEDEKPAGEYPPVQ